MKLTRRTFARFLGVEMNSVELPSGDVCDLAGIPEGAWGIEVFSHYVARTGPALKNSVGDVSKACEKRRYIFGSQVISSECEERRRVMTPDGEKTLHPDEVFIPVYRKPEKM